MTDKTINKAGSVRRVTEAEMAEQRDYISRIRAILAQRNDKPKAFVETYGCQQNSSDSEKIKGMLWDMKSLMKLTERIWFFITPAPLGRMLNLEFSEIWEL